MPARSGGRSAFTLRVSNMKTKIHPEYYQDAQIVCACGNSFTAGATKKVMKVDSCSKCHPFFTGERRMLDTAGRVERFKRRYKMA